MKSIIEYIRQHMFVVVIIVIIGGFVVLAASQRKNVPSENSIEISGVKTFGLTDRTHVDGEVTYDQMPPVGGKHNPTWAQCDGKVYDQPIKNIFAVHSLEHGAVWITYRPGIGEVAIDTLSGKVRGSNYTMMSPFPDQPGKIMLTAWDHQLTVDEADDPRIDQFLDKYRLGPQTQEPGASCQAVGAM